MRRSPKSAPCWQLSTGPWRNASGAAEEEARRRALNEFLADVRVDERRFRLEGRGTMLLQERVSFRNIPLTPWVDRELPAATPLPSPPPLAGAEPVLAEITRPAAPVRKLLR